MGTGDTTLFGKADEDCPVCQELKMNGKEVEIVEMEEDGQYFFPENRMIIKFCPVCGRRIYFNDETEYVRQFSIDVLDDGMVSENKIQKILKKAEFNVLSVAWKATWTVEGYYKSEPPINSD